METEFDGKRDKRGEWQPEKPLSYAPVLEWPARPLAALKWLFGYPGYFFPWGVIYMLFPIVTWVWFTPDMEQMKQFAPSWISYILLRNVVIISIILAAWHGWLYVKKSQDTDWKYSNKWMARDNPTFMFSNQAYDNLFWTYASGVPVWTAYEVFTYWLYANGYIPYVSFSDHPVYCSLMFAIVPLLRDFHFYWAHRISHLGVLYAQAHYLHHKNVSYGPLTGISMHPIEHLIYFSGIIFHWIVPSHPIHALWHVQHAGITPAQGHAGFDRVVLADGIAVGTGDFFHYLHHKYFECNYGSDGPFPLDRWFGTFHDGTLQSQTRMNERLMIRAAQKARAEGSEL